MTDPLGQAMADYYYKKRRGKLWILNQYGPREEMPVGAYFRNYDTMPALEHIALQTCKGRILDIGAGAGSHALALQAQGKQVTALELSALSCDVMQQRGVENIVQQDIFAFHQPRYDSLLLLMNGIGLAGTLDGLKRFVRHAASLLTPGGQLIFDSSDVAYVYEDQLPNPGKYYGEIAYRYQYKNERTDWFNWLYIDRYTMKAILQQEGWKTTILTEDEHGQYLVRATPL
ncbi:MAG TPA: class I SAM-dependent methyltransferase [Chitinophagaceae bacterium]|nr:class I SAM-dependent methyltransferase [Chitinophagaceae bacterium]